MALVVTFHPFKQFGKRIHAGVHQVDVKASVDFPIQTVGQVHGVEILEVDALGPERAGFDALITRQVELPIMVKTADCMPLVLAGSGVVAAVHAGWRGLVADIIPKTVSAMDVDPGDLQIGIGPSLGLCCSEFSDPEREIPERYHWAIKGRFVDLNTIADRQLEDAGVLFKNIERINVCTKCSPEWFSWRRDADQQRFGTVISLVK